MAMIARLLRPWLGWLASNDKRHMTVDSGGVNTGLAYAGELLVACNGMGVGLTAIHNLTLSMAAAR